MTKPNLSDSQAYLFYIDGKLIGAGLFHKYERYGCSLHGDDPKEYLLFNRIKSSGKTGSLTSVEIAGHLEAVPINGLPAIDKLISIRKASGSCK